MPTIDLILLKPYFQASERRITTGGLFARNRIATLPFNGYGEEVAQLYKGMDLRKNY